MVTVGNSLTTGQSIGPDTETTSTVNKSHVSGTMNESGEKGTKTIPRPKSDGEREPMKNRRKFKIHPSKALSQVLNYRLKKYVFMKETRTKLDDRGYVSENGVISDPLNSSIHIHTMLFIYPTNKRYYVVLTQDSFADIFCDWIGSVSNCIAMHTSNFCKPLKPLNIAKTLDLVQKRDEELHRYQDRNMDQKPKNYDQNQHSAHHSNNSIEHGLSN